MSDQVNKKAKPRLSSDFAFVLQIADLPDKSSPDVRLVFLNFMCTAATRNDKVRPSVTYSLLADHQFFATRNPLRTSDKP